MPLAFGPSPNQKEKPRTFFKGTGLATGGPPVLQARPVAPFRRGSCFRSLFLRLTIREKGLKDSSNFRDFAARPVIGVDVGLAPWTHPEPFRNLEAAQPFRLFRVVDSAKSPLEANNCLTAAPESEATVSSRSDNRVAPPSAVSERRPAARKA